MYILYCFLFGFSLFCIFVVLYNLVYKAPEIKLWKQMCGNLTENNMTSHSSIKKDGYG